MIRTVIRSVVRSVVQFVVRSRFCRQTTSFRWVKLKQYKSDLFRQGCTLTPKLYLTHLFCDGDERLHSPSPASSKPSLYFLSIWLMAKPLTPHQGAPVYSTAMWLPLEQLLFPRLPHWGRYICSLGRHPCIPN